MDASGQEKTMGLPLSRPSHRIPLWLKVGYTAFVAVLVPVYWYHYTPVNFLYFCDVALLLTVPAIWLESSFLASTQAVGITLPQLLWQVDFVSYALVRVHFPVDLTNYMFEAERPIFLRGLSFFHFWLPILLLWMVWRLGYDRRALLGQIVISCLVLALSYFFTTDIHGPPGNVNKVFGPNSETPQTWMHPLLWLAVVMVVMPVVIYLPTHFCLRRLMPQRQGDQGPFLPPTGAGAMFSPSAKPEDE
jgi:hypothetical protein